MWAIRLRRQGKSNMKSCMHCNLATSYHVILVSIAFLLLCILVIPVGWSLGAFYLQLYSSNYCYWKLVVPLPDRLFTTLRACCLDLPPPQRHPKFIKKQPLNLHAYNTQKQRHRHPKNLSKPVLERSRSHSKSQVSKKHVFYKKHCFLQ